MSNFAENTLVIDPGQMRNVGSLDSCLTFIGDANSPKYINHSRLLEVLLLRIQCVGVVEVL